MTVERLSDERLSAERLEELLGSSQMGCSTWEEEEALAAYREASN